MNRMHLLVVILLAAVAVPLASADTIQLNQNNLGISGSIGTVSLTQQGGGVMVTLTANSGYSLKLNGGDVMFNTNVSLNAGNISQLKIDGSYTSSFKFLTGVTRAGNGFAYDVADMMKGTLPHGYVSAKNTISFFISGATVKQLEAGNWGVHFCVGGGTSCGANTGFATGKSAAAVPEPGTLSLLGTGILGMIGVMRRRLFA